MVSPSNLPNGWICKSATGKCCYFIYILVGKQCSYIWFVECCFLFYVYDMDIVWLSLIWFVREDGLELGLYKSGTYQKSM
jgi:hypothetical protein